MFVSASPNLGAWERTDTALGYLHPRTRTPPGGSPVPRSPWARGGCGAVATGSLLRNRNRALVSSVADERWLPELQPLTRLSRCLGSASSSPGLDLISGPNEEKCPVFQRWSVAGSGGGGGSSSKGRAKVAAAARAPGEWGEPHSPSLSKVCFAPCDDFPGRSG